MVAATVLQYVDIHIPFLEIVVIEVSDGETYDSRKLSVVDAVLPGLNSDNDLSGFNATRSGKTVTINHTGTADRRVTLLLAGRP